MKDFNVDLIAYLALNECAKEEHDSGAVEDIQSKMRVHAGKLKDNNFNIKLKW